MILCYNNGHLIWSQSRKTKTIPWAESAILGHLWFHHVEDCFPENMRSKEPLQKCRRESYLRQLSSRVPEDFGICVKWPSLAENLCKTEFFFTKFGSWRETISNFLAKSRWSWSLLHIYKYATQPLTVENCRLCPFEMDPKHQLPQKWQVRLCSILQS